MLLEVIEYLMEHGADSFGTKSEKTGMNAYEFALQNQQNAMKNNKELLPDSIINKIIEILLNTKQKVFHPKVQPRLAGQR